MLQKLIFHKHLEQGEEIDYAVHKHWIDILKPIFLLLLFGLILPWGLYGMGFNTSAFFWLGLGWSTMGLFRFIYMFVDWYADAFLITSMAIVRVEWRGFFSNAATRMGFEDIEGVSYEVAGFWPTVLGYGQITLKSVSGNVLKLSPAKNPKEVELKVMDYQQRYIRDKNMSDTNKLKQILSQMVVNHLERQVK